jgi:hypothetical protein
MRVLKSADTAQVEVFSCARPSANDCSHLDISDCSLIQALASRGWRVEAREAGGIGKLTMSNAANAADFFCPTVLHDAMQEHF